MPPLISPQLRFKTSFKMAISKLRFMQTKKTAINKQQRRQMGELLGQGKEESAKIRVENIIRDDILVELLELLELYCELLLARLSLLMSPTIERIQRDGKDVEVQRPDVGLEEAIQSIIFAAPYTEIKEMTSIRELLMAKYGREYCHVALDLKDEGNRVPERIRQKCDINPPSKSLVTLYLSEIAKAYRVPFSEMVEDEEEEEDVDDEDDEGADGGIAVLEPPLSDEVDGSGGQLIMDKNKDPILVSPPSKTTENRRPSVTIPKGVQVKKKRPSDVGVGKKKEDELDDLRKRFDALKRL